MARALRGNWAASRFNATGVPLKKTCAISACHSATPTSLARYLDVTDEHSSERDLLSQFLGNNPSALIYAPLKLPGARAYWGSPGGFWRYT